MKSKKLAIPYIIWLFAFTIVPLVLIATNAFQGSHGGFTLDNIAKAWSSEYLHALLYSLEIAFVSTLICLLLAYPASYIISQMKARTQAIITMLITIPMWMNILLRLLGWYILLQNGGPIHTVLSLLGIDAPILGTDAAVVLGMVYEFLPFMIMPLHTVMSKIDRSHIEAAQDLGANKFNILRKVIFPLSVPGIVSGITMVFVPSASTFIVTKYLGGMHLMIGDYIEAAFLCADRNFGAALALTLMVIIIIFMVITNRFGDEEAVGV
ncbi:MAG: ABC transporter permease [Eubacteriales bacterium]|nr:ABC transporter permease [Eubacteriales bacterium]